MLLIVEIDFLRVSRSSVDDTITQHLNALVEPSRIGFDPSSTSLRGARPPSRQIDPASSRNFKDKVLFPAWQTRSHVLSYCALVATSPDPDDPEAAIRESENERNRERVVDERLDPYSGRYFPREPRTEQLASTIRMEQGIENIVRTRTWDIVKERCGESAATWKEALSEWRKKQELGQKSTVRE